MRRSPLPSMDVSLHYFLSRVTESVKITLEPLTQRSLTSK